MISSSKLIRVLLTPFSKQVIGVTRRMTGSICSSGSDGDKKDEDKKPCQVCPCCACPSDYNPSTPTMYDSRKYGHCLPSNDVMPPFDPVLNVPTGIFRCTVGEVLGCGADKCGCYQCAEYFSYHNMSYYDVHLILRGVRIPSPNSGRKP